MPTDDFPAGGLTGFFNGLADFVVGFGKRMFVHICALVVGIIAGLGFNLPGALLGSGLPVALGCYVGLICLFPRGSAKKPEWLIPSVTGILLALFWVYLGVPWQFCLLWGGTLTWTIRLINKMGMMDWEWAVLPFLLLAMAGFFNTLVPLSPIKPPYLTFPIFAAAGWAVTRFYSAMRGDSSQRDMLAAACCNIDRMLTDRKLPFDLEGPVHQLAIHGKRLLELKPRMTAATAPLVREIGKTTATLNRIGQNLSPMGSAKAQSKLADLNDSLQKLIKELEPPKEIPLDQAIDVALQKRLDEYRRISRVILDKSTSLPLEMQNHVRGIARATDSIITCMLEDPRDVAPGDRFLSRYLKAAQTVVEEHARLEAQQSSHQSVVATLAKSKELLSRLENAFVEEHGKLLQNDTVNFTAELNVLDSLLKMEGK